MKTAVEWLQDQFHKDNLSKEFAKVFNSSFEQAKELEKQQIIDAYDLGMGHYGDANCRSDAEQYYK